MLEAIPIYTSDILAGSFDSLPPCTVTAIIFFGSIIFTSVSMATKAWLSGDMRAIKAAHLASFHAHQRFSHPTKTTSSSSSQHSSPKEIAPLDISFKSIYILLHHFSIIGLIIFIIYILEYHPPFPNGQRFDFDADMFAFLALICILLGCFTIKRNSSFEDTEDRRHDQKEKKKQKQKHNKIQDTTNGSNSVSNSSETSYEGYVDLLQDNDSKNNGSPLPRRRNPSGNGSIRSDELLSFGVGNGGNDNGARTTKNTLYPLGNNGNSSQFSADKILEEVSLNENKPDMNSVNSSNSDILSEMPVLSSNLDTDVLNIHQSLELKGFMTICFLLYQFTNAYTYDSLSYNPLETTVVNETEDEGDGDTSNESDGVNYYYNISRIFVTAFLFLTGYGHALFFYRDKDYSMSRFIQILFRLNFSGLFLCLALGKPYIFYKACWLHTYFFLFVYFTMRWKNEKNYTKYGLRLKMLFLALVIFLLWDCDNVLWSVHNVLFGTSQQFVEGAPYGELWEFYFRGHLHHWASFMGMLFAINHPVTSLLLRRLESAGSSSEILFKTITGGLLTMATVIWIVGPFDSPKFIYNATNPYFGCLPILCYIYFRNINAIARDYHVEIFKSVGVYSLEVYLLHHHLFVREDGLSKKTLLPGYPTCNLLCTIWLMMVLAKALKTSTSVVIAMFTGQNGKHISSGKNAIGILGTLVIIHAMAIILEFLQMITPEVIATTTIICGILLYQTIMDLTWTDKFVMTLPVNDDASISSVQTTNTISPISKSTSPPILGTVTILFLCLVWQISSLHGNNTSDMLPPICRDTIHDGKWVPIDSCSEFQQGRKARDFHSRSSSTECVDKYNWGWSKNELSSQCQFHFLSPIEAQRKLNGKNVVFMGDTMTRNLFFAACRALGDTSAGAYDEDIPVHSEITKTFGSITLTFKWAPLAADILAKLTAYKPSTDLIITGSGAWDKLRVWVNDEDQKSHITALERLARQLQFLKDNSVPIIWFTPTTMNDQALPNEERHTQMSETSVQETRELYAKSGVNAAASLVLEGHTFTESQAHLSYDGIHYPPQIYNVGAQIMMNSLDWLLPNVKVTNKYVDETFQPRTGSMANPSLGLMILGLIVIGILFFDGFFGLLYIASIFVQPKQMQNRVVTFFSPHEHMNRYSFVPSHVYKELNPFIKDTSQSSSRKTNGSSSLNMSSSGSNSSSNGVGTSSIPSRRSLGNLATISEDSNTHIA